MVYHIPILGEEIVDKLKIKEYGTYIDCTIGFGGHSELIAEKLNSKGKIIGMDLDPYALKMAKEKLEGVGASPYIVNKDMRNFRLNRKFDMIFIGFNSFLHLLTDDDALDCLGCVKQHMHKNSRVLVDIFFRLLSNFFQYVFLSSYIYAMH